MTHNLALLHYGNEYEVQRKMLQKGFGSNTAIERMLPVVEAEMWHLLLHIASEPDNLKQHIRTYVIHMFILFHLKYIDNFRAAGAIILKVTYGYSAETTQPDPLLQETEDTLKLFMLALKPAKWIVDTLPFCKSLLRKLSDKHLPTKHILCFFILSTANSRLDARLRLQANCKTMAKICEWFHRQTILVCEAADGIYFPSSAFTVSKAIPSICALINHEKAAGTAYPSYISTLLEQTAKRPNASEEYLFKHSASAMYGFGSDTVATFFHFLCRACADFKLILIGTSFLMILPPPPEQPSVIDSCHDTRLLSRHGALPRCAEKSSGGDRRCDRFWSATNCRRPW